MQTTTKVILGVTIAAVAGAAIGILLAPEKAKNLRLKIAEGYKGWLAEFSPMIALGKEVLAEVTTHDDESGDRGNELKKLTKNF